MLWLVDCPYFDQGQVRPIVSANGRVMLQCDECSSVWCEPENIEVETSVEPRSPDFAACGDQLAPGTSRWATMDDLKQAGWDKLDWKNDLLTPADWTRETSAETDS